MSLLDAIRGAIAPDTVDNLAVRLGESPQATGSALGGIIPVILAALTRRVDGGGAGGVVNMIKGALAGGDPLDHQISIADGLGPDHAFTRQGGGFSDLFGSNLGGITSALASQFGIKPSSAQTLLGVGGLFTAGGIGRMLGREPTAQGVTDLLHGERAAINATLPAGFAGILGQHDTAETTTRAYDAEERRSAGGFKWWPLLLLALAVVALIWALRSCNREQTTTVVSESETDVVVPVPTPAVPTGAGVISDLIEGRPVLRVFFAIGKSDVTRDLSTAADGVKDYLTAHPGSTVAVAGYNDPTGDAAANAALSKRRAEEVSKALQAAGIPAKSIVLVKPADATGTGETNAESRRVDVTVTE